MSFMVINTMVDVVSLKTYGRVSGRWKDDLNYTVSECSENTMPCIQNG